ncbi:hypothetical protein D1C59_16080 [Salmonella enterica]|nr:hypothetical protein [Salmonella enterica]EBI2791622.1 hypothetical protein [Salmonella enterica]EBL1340774.1 hypothetical protein [Salmonella enterica]EBN2057094.1 hypothetical protein [Salmonella enterica]HBX1298013.1 hypothetical protein [Salmonella enterica]
MKNNPYSENLRIARVQRKKLERIAEKLVDMSSEWDGIDGCMENDLADLADQIHAQLRAYREITECWRKGHAGNMAVKFDPPAWWVMKEKAQVF